MRDVEMDGQRQWPSLLRVFENSGEWAELNCSSYSPVLRQPLTQLLVGMGDRGTEGRPNGSQDLWVLAGVESATEAYMLLGAASRKAKHIITVGWGSAREGTPFNPTTEPGPHCKTGNLAVSSLNSWL